MKKLILLAVMLSVVEASFSQMKITKATQQKTFAGMGGVFMNYFIVFNSKSSDKIEIDSVKTIADTTDIKFGFTKMDPCCKNEISFSYGISSSPKCKTCPDATPKPFNTTKGVIVYYHNGEKKNNFNVKKFKQLPDLRLP